MITLNMQQKKTEVKITETMFDTENNVLTLQILVLNGGSDYDLTGKTITASFSPTGKETEILSVVDGLIQLPIYSSYVKGGSNIFHLNFRWGTDKVEISPAVIWTIKSTIKTSGIAQSNVDIVTSLIAKLNTAIENVGEITAGAEGDSAYEVAVNNGFSGTEAEWLISLKGETGSQGAQGIQGIKGDTGAKGDAGSQGIQGLKGDIGLQGAKGDTGSQGIQGERGLQGIQGIQGIKGDTGSAGYTPIKGIDYFDGVQGIKGETGEQGIQGIQGVKGDAGEQGIQGIQGNPGTNGTGIVNQRTATELSLWAGTQAQYDALTPDANTVYLISG